MEANRRRSPDPEGAEAPGQERHAAGAWRATAPPATLGWSCPACRRPLPDRDPWRCAGCGARYGTLGGTPLLVADPQEYLHRTLGELEDQCAEQAATLGKVRRALADERLAWRRPVMSRVERALESNLRLSRSLMPPVAALMAELGGAPRHAPGASLLPPPLPQYGPQNLEYLRYDWSGGSRAEREIAKVEARIGDQIDRYCPAGAAAFLGAGAGRYAVDLSARFTHSFAVELCYSYAALFRRLQDGPVRFHTINLRMPSPGEPATVEHLAAFPKGCEALDRLSYVIADARRLPLPDGSLSAVLSIYFQDILPFEELLPEVIRVLRPGGRFINFGPLHYHHEEPAAQLVPEEVLELAGRLGLQLAEERWLPLAHLRAPHRGELFIHQAWSYVMTKRG